MWFFGTRDKSGMRSFMFAENKKDKCFELFTPTYQVINEVIKNGFGIFCFLTKEFG